METCRAVVVLACLTVAASVVAQEPPKPPPAIERIMKEVESGRMPTPAEMKQLAEWGQKAAASGGVKVEVPPVGELASATARAGAPPQRDACPTRQVVRAKAPRDKVWPNVVAALTRTYAEKAGAAMKGFADKAAAVAKAPHEMAGVGAMLAMRGLGSAAVYATLLDAARDDDPVTLANLGNFLDDLDDREAALDVLLYARARFPGSPFVATNLGWVLYAAGDRVAALAAFSAALARQPGFPPALEGKAMLALCGGHVAEARALASQVLESVAAPAMNEIVNPSVSGRRTDAPDRGDGGDGSSAGRGGSDGRGSPGTSAGAAGSPRRRFPRLPYWRAPDPPFGASAKVFAVDNRAPATSPAARCPPAASRSASARSRCSSSARA